MADLQVGNTDEFGSSGDFGDFGITLAEVECLESIHDISGKVKAPYFGQIFTSSQKSPNLL